MPFKLGQLRTICNFEIITKIGLKMYRSIQMESKIKNQHINKSFPKCFQSKN